MRCWLTTGAVLAALLLNLTSSTDVEACGRGRHRRSCESCCTVPCWARCIVVHPQFHQKGEITKPSPCPPGYICLCCENGSCVPCDSDCTGALMCVLPGKPRPICPDYLLAS